MKIRNYLNDILNELNAMSKHLNVEEVEKIMELIVNSNHIFLDGAGRSGLVVQAFANRLLHLGFSVSVVGEISSPRSRENDLLIICSGSGETDRLINLAKKAKEKKLKVALITKNKKSALGKLSDCVINIEHKKTEQIELEQPMGTTFEQFCFLYFDNIILNLAELTSQSFSAMMARHADFE